VKLGVRPCAAPPSEASAVRVELFLPKVICFLLFSEHQFSDQTNFPMNAMHYYNAKRTMNKKGLTIASQIRYVQVFYKFL
jgi:hypothetical protein